MLQEDVKWFAETGSRPARITVYVNGTLPAEVEGIPRTIEMFAIPRAEVEALVTRCGGDLLAVDPDDAPGPSLESLRYFARKAARTAHE